MKRIYLLLLLSVTCFARPDGDYQVMQSDDILDPYNLPAEIPQDSNKKLAWGLIKRNFAVIEEALRAVDNPYGVSRWVKRQPGDQDYKYYGERRALSPYWLLTYKSHGVDGKQPIFDRSNSVESMIAEMDELYAAVEFLMQHNISIDEGIFNGLGSFKSYHWELSFRNYYNHLGQNFRCDLPDAVIEYGYDMIGRIELLIEKYQPTGVRTLAEEAFVRLLPVDAIDGRRDKGLPQEVPVHPQSKFAYGLFALNKAIIAEALDAGANPYRPQDGVKNWDRARSNEWSPYLLILMNTFARINDYKEGVSFSSAIQLLYEIAELFLHRGIALGRGYQVDLTGKVAAHGFLEPMVDYLKHDAYAASFEEHGMHEDAAAIRIYWPKFVALVEQYQPEFMALAREHVRLNLPTCSTF